MDSLEKEIQLIKKRELIKDTYRDVTNPRGSKGLPGNNRASREETSRSASVVKSPKKHNVNVTNRAATISNNAYPDLNLNTIVQRLLDKFGDSVTSVIKNMAADIRLLVETVSKKEDKYDSEPTTRSGQRKVSGQNIATSGKRMGKSQGKRKERHFQLENSDATSDLKRRETR